MEGSEKKEAEGKGTGWAALLAIAALAGCIVYFGVFTDELAAIVGGAGWFFSACADDIAAKGESVEKEEA